MSVNLTENILAENNRVFFSFLFFNGYIFLYVFSYSAPGMHQFLFVWLKGLQRVCEKDTKNNNAEKRSRFTQQKMSRERFEIETNLLSGQQEVLVSIGAQETRVAVTLHQLVDVVLKEKNIGG